MTEFSIPTIDGFTSTTEKVGDVRLHYWLGGDPNGPPILLWHGFLATAHSWYKLMPLLAVAGYHVLAPDMRGYGDSDKPAGTGYDGLTLVEDFRDLARQIGFSQGEAVLLMGHDMGAPPALLWAAKYPEEVKGLVYLEEPALLPDVLANIIVYKPETMTNGSLWWWPLALATDMPERLIVGNEEKFLSWFYQTYTADQASIPKAAVAETLRSFRGAEGVNGAFGVYRAAFATIDQTRPLMEHKLTLPILAIGGEKVLGADVASTVRLLATNVRGEVIANCGHFIPEEQPDELMRLVKDFTDSL